MGDVFDLMKKSVLFSVGLVAFTVEKTGEMIDDFVKRGDEAMEKTRETLDKMTKTGTDLDEKIKTHINEALEKMDIPTKKDIQELNKKIDQIAKKI